MLAEHQVWANVLASDLKKWMQRNGYGKTGGKKILALKMGVSPDIFGRITRANHISSPENYALIYLGTGLESAAPWKMPKIRANKKEWTQVDYLNWKFEHLKDLKSGVVLTTAPVAPPSQERVDEALRDAQIELDEEIARLNRPLDTATPSIESHVEKIIDLVTQRIIDGVNDGLRGSDGSLKDLLNQLDRELDRVFDGSVAERDAFIREHGKALGTLFPILETLMAPKSEREQRILMMRR